MSEDLKAQLIKEYGFDKGMQLAMVVVPSIMKDFEKKVSNSLIGTTVSEEYAFDKGGGRIKLYGRRKADGGCEILRKEFVL